MAADNLVVAGSRFVDSPTAADNLLVDSLAVADSRLVDSRLVVIHFLVDSPAVADNLLVVQVDWDPVPGSDSMTSILPHFFLPDIDEFTMKINELIVLPDFKLSYKYMNYYVL